jgi:hypothetical protein
MDDKLKTNTPSEISGEDVRGLFFMDYTYFEGEERLPRWIRSPYKDCIYISQRMSNLDFSRVENFRIQSLEDLIVMVDEKGRREIECLYKNIDFEPKFQKIEYLFDSGYKVSREMLNYHTGRIPLNFY